MWNVRLRKNLTSDSLSCDPEKYQGRPFTGGLLYGIRKRVAKFRISGPISLTLLIAGISSQAMPDERIARAQ